MDPNKIFAHSEATKPVPTITEFLTCTTPTEITNVSGTNREFIQNFAVLPCFLSTALYDLDDWSAESVFFKLQHTIQLHRDNILISKTSQQTPPTPTVTQDEANNNTPNTQEKNQPTPPTLSNDELETEQNLFLLILIFLWSIIKHVFCPTPRLSERHHHEIPRPNINNVSHLPFQYHQIHHLNSPKWRPNIPNSSPLF